MNGGLIAVLHGHVGGITHIEFSSDGNQLYSGARKVIRIDLKTKGNREFVNRME